MLFQLYTYKLPLIEGCFYTHKIREGIILESPEHHVFAEAAPLPGYSKESFSDALVQLQTAQSLLLQDATLPSLLQNRTFSSSVLFALYSLHAQISSPKSSPYEVPIRRYIDISYRNNSFDTLLKELLTLSSDTVAKIKLGSYPVSIAIPMMRSIIDSCKASLHLDINSQWSLKDALLFSSSFKEGSFLSIEDPVENLSDLREFAKHSPHPIALDHVLRTQSIQDLLSLPNLTTCEFKPTLDMHLLLDSALLKRLRQQGIRYTFSSCYETAIGIAAIGRLGSLRATNTPLGIDTLGVFTQDILISPLERVDSCMILPERLFPNKNLLTPL